MSIIPEGQYASITPDRFAALSLLRGADGIERTKADPTSWFFMILDMHRAVYCAMIAALTGTMGIGAFSAKLQAEWIAYFEGSRSNPKLKQPEGDYVLRFQDLLERAESGTADMMGPPLQLTPEQRTDLLKLNEFRADLEHVNLSHGLSK